MMKNVDQLTVQDARRSRTHHLTQLEQDFHNGIDITALVARNSAFYDVLIKRAWQDVPDQHACLVAIGSYGRSELLPYSDIDLLILCEHTPEKTLASAIENFVRFLWDCQIEVGHSVRTITQALSFAKQDLSAFTHLLEARCLAGSQELFNRYNEARLRDDMWPSKTFFAAKSEERDKRYRKYDDTSYNLEPNIKSGPGGLRDIHQLRWIARRHIDISHLRELIANHLITEEEYSTLKSGLFFLWRIAFALHFLAKKAEYRLLFDYQPLLAKEFAYADEPHALAVEQFMKNFYRQVRMIRTLNDLFTQLFREEIVDKEPKITQINEHFRAHNHYLEVSDPDLFFKQPHTLLELFVVLACNPTLRGIRAKTTRLIRAANHLIDDDFRQQPQHRELFLQFLKQGKTVSKQLSRMNRYDVLSRYLPCFGQIVGMMQYDLYHSYSVDQHTIFLVRNIERYTQTEFRSAFSLAADIMENIPTTELLYIAAIFHDIGKGRGGNHSIHGALEAEQFCRDHQLATHDSELITWLVRHHLLMSHTAQRKDIHDPMVLQQFATAVGDQRHLDYLYLLTVADICATNPTLWNSWRDSLLKELYQLTKALLATHHKNLDVAQIIADKKQACLIALTQQGISSERIAEVWQQFDDNYFLREFTTRIIWHTSTLAEHHSEKPLVVVHQHYAQGATEIVVYAPFRENLFVAITTHIANHQLNIVEARVVTTKNHFVLATFVVLDEFSKQIANVDRQQYLRSSLSKVVSTDDKRAALIKRRLSRRIRHFSMVPKVSFAHDDASGMTLMTVSSHDRPGLLSLICKALLECHITLHHARIITLGGRVEDVFAISTRTNDPIDEPAMRETLQQKIAKYLA